MYTVVHRFSHTQTHTRTQKQSAGCLPRGMPLLRRCELPMAYSPASQHTTQTYRVHTAHMNRNPVSIWRLWLPRFPQSFFQPLSDKHTHVLPLFSPTPPFHPLDSPALSISPSYPSLFPSLPSLALPSFPSLFYYFVPTSLSTFMPKSQ